MAKMNPPGSAYMIMDLSLHVSVSLCVSEHVLLCACVYMQRMHVSLLRRIEDHCSSISMPLSCGQ